jgi:hypothetical protein
MAITQEQKREKAFAKLREEATEKRKKWKKTFICKGDPEIDCLRWYITDHDPLGKHYPSRYRLEGYQYGQCAMSMSLSCAENPRDYMPDKLRAKALELLSSIYSTTPV